MYVNAARLSTLRSTVCTTQRTKNPAQVFHETCVVDKSVRRAESPTRVCRTNFCRGDMFYTTVLDVLHT